MNQKFDIGLNAKLNEFAKKFGIKRTYKNDSYVFENFGNYVISSVLLEDKIEDISSISTNGAQGIDGIIFIINNRLITNESDLETIGAFEKIDIKIGFVQSTIEKSFDTQKFSAFTDEVVKFLIGNINIEPFSNIYNKLLNDNGKYINLIDDTPSISLYFLSAKTKHNISIKTIESEKQKIANRKELQGRCNLSEFKLYQINEIKEEYEKIEKFHSVQIELSPNIQLPNVSDDIEMGILAPIKFSEFKKLILTKDKKLKERLFVENVRSYIGDTKINNDIRNTLDNEDDRKFSNILIMA